MNSFLGVAALMVAFVAFVPAWASADGCRSTSTAGTLESLNQRRVARIIVKSKGLAPDTTDEGSGVLISPNGHLLTARHVIEQTIDSRRTGDGKTEESWRDGSEIRLKFYNGFNGEEAREYSAHWVRAWKDYDLALLKVDDVDAALRARGFVPISFSGALAGKCFDILGMSYWVTEMPGGKRGPEVPRYEWGAGTFMRHIDNWRIAVRSNVYKGFSGGPVFLALDTWYLVGIVISGREDRTETKLIRSLGAIETELQTLVGKGVLHVLDPVPFPSSEFQRFTKLDFAKSSQEQINGYVARVLMNRDLTIQFVDAVSKERFTGGIGGGQKNLSVKGREMLEHARLIMAKGDWDPDLFSRLIEKIVEAWEQIGGAAGPTGDGDARNVIVSRLREDVDYHERHCPRSPAPARAECLRRVVAKRQALVLDRALRFYHQRADSYYRFNDGGDRNLEARQVIYWAEQSFVGLYDWSRSLQILAGLPDALLAESSFHTILFFDGFPGPAPGGKWPIKVFYLTAAADKTVRGLTVASDLRGDQILAIALGGKANQALVNQLCGKSLELLDQIDQGLDSAVFEQNAYRGQMKALSATLAKGQCARVVSRP